MRNYIFMFAAALFLLIASCGGSNTKQEGDDATIKEEEKIADEVMKSSEEAKSDAEQTEKEVEKLLEDI